MSGVAAYDVVVVGSGGGALTAALRAHDLGLSVLVVEKSGHYGGTTAVSGGGIWVPCNDQIAGLGGNDSFDEALTYCRTVIGDGFDEARVRAYLDNAPLMVRYLAAQADAHFLAVARYPDYYPDQPGGKPGYRTMEPAPFDARRLGAEYERLRPPFGATMIAHRITVTQVEAQQIFCKEPGWVGVLFKRAFSYALDVRWRWRSKRDRRLTLGNALIAGLRRALLERDVPLWLETPMQSLTSEHGRITGVEVLHQGRPLTIAARCGVVLGTGGFESNQAMRDQYLPQPSRTEWTAAPRINHGDGIRAGQAAGGSLALMDHVWGVPTVHVPGEDRQRGLFIERASPGCVLVNREGRRFVNENAPYPDIINAMYADNAGSHGAVPAWLVFDATFRRNYPCGPLLPGKVQPDGRMPEGLMDKAIFRADSLEALAQKIGVDAVALVATAKRMTRFAQTGTDEEFGKGGNVFDRYYGDPTVKPNPCLGPIEKAPFYAMRLDPGEIGTKGGLRTDIHARVIRDDDSVVQGLYAIGNTSAAVMGRTYPGPGSTIGPAMTFGYVAANHLAHSAQDATPGEA